MSRSQELESLCGISQSLDVDGSLHFYGVVGFFQNKLGRLLFKHSSRGMFGAKANRVLRRSLFHTFSNPQTTKYVKPAPRPIPEQASKQAAPKSHTIEWRGRISTKSRCFTNGASTLAFKRVLIDFVFGFFVVPNFSASSNPHNSGRSRRLRIRRLGRTTGGVYCRSQKTPIIYSCFKYHRLARLN